MYQRKRRNKFQVDLDTECSLTSAHSTHESMGGKRHWLIAVDEFSDCSHSFFLRKKSDQTVMIPIWIKGLKTKYGIDVKNIRLDNSGEIRSLQKECEKQNLGIIFQFTAPGTPQKLSC